MRYAIGVGSNRGDRAAILAAAARSLAEDPALTLLSTSSLIENPAIGGPSGQGDFLNGAWIVGSALGPHQLLARLQDLETRFGRVRTLAAGPRTLDCDLLLRDDGLSMCSPQLCLPHPHVHQRSFVLRPLVEVAGDWIHPWFGCDLATLWRRFPGVVG
jgi:2-amino-4-hydroxy-6-hydroxymethyldihydropteridine diphosphokinase